MLKILRYHLDYAQDFTEICEATQNEWLGISPQRWHQMENPQSEILERDGEIIMAEWNEALVGTAFYSQRNGLYFLEGLCVLRDFRGLGIGRSLLNDLISTLMKRDIPGLYVELFDTAIHYVPWFEKKGFQYVDGQPHLKQRIRLVKYF